MADKNTRWETFKEWAAWTVRDEIYGYVRDHWGRTIVFALASFGGAFLAFIRLHAVIGYCAATATVTITILGTLARIDGRKRRAAELQKLKRRSLDTPIDSPKTKPESPESKAASPKARLEIEYGNEPSLLITNEGSAADFFGVFTASGPVDIAPGSFCKWVHSNSIRTRIAKGQTSKILLAKLNWTSPPFITSQWEVQTTTERGPRSVSALYSSSGNRDEFPFKIILTGQIFADPDLEDGPQPFKVVLHSRGSGSE